MKATAPYNSIYMVLSVSFYSKKGKEVMII